jgi:hypothetical protein
MIAVTGPNRALMGEAGLAVHFAVPGGDVAITGPLGLVAAVRAKLDWPRPRTSPSAPGPCGSSAG